MVAKEPDSLTLFFQNPANIHRLSISQLQKLTDLQARIDELNAHNLSDFELANRDIQVRHLRNEMSAVVETAMVDGDIAHQTASTANITASSPRHMASINGRHFG
jgi:hypothetical protein